MKIVKFEDNTYGLRRCSPFGFQYCSLTSDDIWFCNGVYRTKRCQGTLDEVMEMHAKQIKIKSKLKDRGKVIDPYR